MEGFSISQLAQFSGIKAHTIRAWEQRYNALTPGRSVGNTRYYSNDQLKRLLNIVSLLDYDHKVSQLCVMQDEELHELLEEKKHDESGDMKYGFYISQLISAGVIYDELYFEKIFANCLLTIGFKETYSMVIVPLLKRLGLMWRIDKLPPAQEHFVSNLIRQKIFVAIDSLPPPKSEKGTAILFLPENEFHEIPLLFAHFILRFHEVKSIYLGANVPKGSLLETVRAIEPDHLLFFLVHQDIPENVNLWISELSEVHIGNIFVAGNTTLLKKLDNGKKDQLKIIHSITDLENYFT
ncbi:MAG: MerR family transcriptional regulator [Ginsengibacter sp.]|jgi:DNA-binding transcriptional MerR regulator